MGAKKDYRRMCVSCKHVAVTKYLSGAHCRLMYAKAGEKQASKESRVSLFGTCGLFEQWHEKNRV